MITFDLESKLEEEQMAGFLRLSGKELQSGAQAGCERKFTVHSIFILKRSKAASQSSKLSKEVFNENVNEVVDCVIPI